MISLFILDNFKVHIRLMSLGLCPLAILLVILRFRHWFFILREKEVLLFLVPNEPLDFIDFRLLALSAFFGARFFSFYYLQETFFLQISLLILNFLLVSYSPKHLELLIQKDWFFITLLLFLFVYVELFLLGFVRMDIKVSRELAVFSRSVLQRHSEIHFVVNRFCIKLVIFFHIY